MPIQIIKDETFTNLALFLEKMDHYWLIRCTFTGTPRDSKLVTQEAFVMAMGYASLTITGCKFPKITGGGIALRSTIGSLRTRITYNDFSEISGNAIISKPGNYNVRIKRNTFKECGMEVSGLKHPMYLMSEDVEAIKNIINGTNGDGISIRGSGRLEGNTILNTGKNPIKYFSDGNPGPINILKINKNKLYPSKNGYPAIQLLYSPTTGSEMVAKYKIRKNKTPGAVKPFLASEKFDGMYEYSA